MFGLFKKRCGICKRKITAYQRYCVSVNRKAKVCLACCEYAERRAWRRC